MKKSKAFSVGISYAKQTFPCKIALKCRFSSVIMTCQSLWDFFLGGGTVMPVPCISSSLFFVFCYGHRFMISIAKVLSAWPILDFIYGAVDSHQQAPLEVGTPLLCNAAEENN